MPYRPTEVVSADELESIHVGLAPGPDRDRHGLPRRRGARPPGGGRRDRRSGHAARPLRSGRWSRERHPDGAVRRSPSTPGTRPTTSAIGGDWIAFGTVGSAAQRRGPRPRPPDRQPRGLPEPAAPGPDAQLASTSSPATRSSRSTSTTSVRHLHATHDALTLMDKPIHAYCLGRQRNIDALEMVRIARGVDDATLDRSRRSSPSSTRSSPLRLDAPMLQGIIEFARATRSSCITPVHAGRRDGAGDAGRGARRAERRGAGGHGPDPGRPARRAGHLRRLHLERRHAVGRAGLRDAGVHADGDGRRPARPAVRRAVPVVQRQRGQRPRRPGRLRVRVLAVGRDHGRRQPAHARRRLDGGRPPRRATRR